MPSLMAPSSFSTFSSLRQRVLACCVGWGGLLCTEGRRDFPPILDGNYTWQGWWMFSPPCTLSSLPADFMKRHRPTFGINNGEIQGANLKAGARRWKKGLLLPLVDSRGNGSQERDDRMWLIQSVQGLKGNIHQAARDRLIVMYDHQVPLVRDPIFWPYKHRFCIYVVLCMANEHFACFISFFTPSQNRTVAIINLKRNARVQGHLLKAVTLTLSDPLKQGCDLFSPVIEPWPFSMLRHWSQTKLEDMAELLLWSPLPPLCLVKGHPGTAVH